MDGFIGPDRLARDGVNAEHLPDSLAVLGILANGHIDAVFIEHRGGDHLAGAIERRVLEWLARLHPVLGWVAVQLPELF